MIDAWLKWLGTICLICIGIGYVCGWVWLFEAKIKCIDTKNALWEQYLSSLSGIFSFQFLCIFFWFPVLCSRLFRKVKRRRFRRLKSTLQRAIEILDILSDSKQSK